MQRSENAYKELEKETVQVNLFLEFLLLQLLSKIHRILTPRGRQRQIAVEIKVPAEFIWPWFRAIGIYPRDRENTNVKYIPVKKPRRGFTQHAGATVTFKTLPSINLHFKKILGNSIYGYFKRQLRQGGQAKCVITEEDPAIMTYTVSSKKLVFTCKYVLLNRYGIEC